MATAHGSLEDCAGCHVDVASGPVGWLHKVFAAANPRKDAMACLGCHTVGATAINPHTAKLDRLERTTNRLRTRPAPATNAVDRLREAVFPVSRTFPEGVYCQTCHKEHKGDQFDLKSMPDSRCQACHVVKVRSFAGDHPEFDAYPFRRRTRINFDHNSHFNKHFPDQLAKNDPSTAVPKQCNSCHVIAAGGRQMGVKSFKQVCSDCHLGQIVGTDRVEGLKGITLMSLPGLDVDTLAEKGADIGEWPSESDAELSPFLQVLMSRDPRRKKMLEKISGIDLLDLSEQSDEAIKTVQAVVWELKAFLARLATDKPSAVLAGLDNDNAAGRDPENLARLTASMPRDVLLGAQRQWLPNLTSELDQWRRKLADASDAADPGQDDADKEAAGLKEPADEPEFKIDAEAWSEFGGWYRQDYSLVYRPRGHADEFMKTWLDLSGRLYRDVTNKPAKAIFQLLSAENAQGQCIKCHSVDAASDGSRLVNWSPALPAMSKSRFTVFSHNPHLAVIGKEGCLTCHKLNATAKSQDSYAQNDPARFESNFESISRRACQTCHKPEAVRSDCLLCHVYHVGEVTSPFPETTLSSK